MHDSDGGAAAYEASGDNVLIAACLEGTPAAWEALVQRYSNLVYSVARRYGLDDDDAADVFQNTWSALWERLGELRDYSRLSPWLLTVSARLSYQQRERQHRLPIPHDVARALRGRPDSATQPEEQAVMADEAAQVRAAMARLPDRCRRLLEILFYDTPAPSYVEIARQLGTTPDSLGPRRARCLQQLRKLLESEGF